jgi:hypothetical protein
MAIGSGSWGSPVTLHPGNAGNLDVDLVAPHFKQSIRIGIQSMQVLSVKIVTDFRAHN